MAGLRITVYAYGNEITVHAEENGMYMDEAEFHPSEAGLAAKHVEELVKAFLDRVYKRRDSGRG
mgnify:CR=1 FL=1